MPADDATTGGRAPPDRSDWGHEGADKGHVQGEGWGEALLQTKRDLEATDRRLHKLAQDEHVEKVGYVM